MRRVSISSVAGDIQVTGVPGLRVVRASGAEGVELTQEGETVRVTSNRRLDNPTEISWLDTVFKAIGRVIPTNITLEVPQDLEKIEVSAMAGNVRVEGVHGRLEVDSVAGNVDVRDATSLRVSSTAGNVDARARLSDGEHSVRTQAGNANVRLESGSDARLEVSVGAGDMNVKGFQITKTERRVVGGSLEGRVGNGSARLEVRVTAGNARVDADGGGQ